MEKICLYRVRLQELSPTELEMRGGISWDSVVKVIKIVAKVVNFIRDYKDDMKNGFEKGWRML